ncbi:MAG: SIS domain-containing protein [Acetivibrionales bacterium]|jgi:glucosamine--fructose-6-phosphate aminotransferase (isomerizing)
MTLMLNEIQEQPQSLERCLRNNISTIKKLVEAIHRKNISSVIMAARGTSGHAALYAKYVTEVLTGIPVALAAPSVTTLYNRQLDCKDSLVIGVSQSGKAADVLEVIKSANNSGAVTVGVTNDPASPLALEAAFHLDCSAGPEKSVAATKTFTTQMLLLAEMSAEWADDKGTLIELAKVPEIMSQTLSNTNSIKEAAERYSFMNECFVIARGINFPIALECALKIQETTYTRAKAFASSEFYHGPIAMVDESIPVIIFAPNGPTIEDSIAMFNKLKENNTNIISVSNNESLLKSAACGLRIPDTENDVISPFINAAIAQTFACNLSLCKGLNPDKPRRLNKVTITK